MNQVELLDCTLRDGGYAVKWNFGSNTIVNIFSRLVSSGVDIIELGYLRDWEEFDNNKTSLPKVKDFDAVFDVNFTHRPMLVAMIDLGNCRIENICDAKDTIIDGIRLTFKKARIDEAMEFAKQIIAKGYKLFLQSVSITDYSDAEYLQLIERLNEVKPYAISIVDTYGLMFDYDLMNYFRLLDHNLDSEIRIGYHPHNNFQMAFANAVEIINGRSRHRLVIDTTVNGIGKDSGNACTELMAYYLNENFGRQFQISHLLEIIDSELSKLRERLTWGYSYIGFISATNHCRTEYTKYLLAKKTLSVASINTILSRIAPDKRTTAFHEDHIAQLYAEYQANDMNDEAAVAQLREALEGRKLLLMAPGKSLQAEEAKINGFLAKEKPVVIAVNHVPSQYPVNYVFVSNGQRYGRILHLLRKWHGSMKIIVTSNIMDELDVCDYVVNYSSLTAEMELKDNSMLMLLQLLKKIGVQEVWFAGFDGFSSHESSNYFDQYLVLNEQTHQKGLNESIIHELQKLSGGIKMHFVTASEYEVGLR